jgi:hypothetical protein
MQNFTQKMISVGILAVVFLFFLGSLQQHCSITFLPITWAPGVRILPFKDHFEALFQRDAVLQSNTSFDSFQPAGRADWPPDPWDLLGDFGISLPPTHAITPQNFSQSFGNSWEDGFEIVRTKVLSSLWTGYSKALAVYRHVATQHESEAIDIPSHRPYYNWQ